VLEVRVRFALLAILIVLIATSPIGLGGTASAGGLAPVDLKIDVAAILDELGKGIGAIVDDIQKYQKDRRSIGRLQVALGELTAHSRIWIVDAKSLSSNASSEDAQELLIDDTARVEESLRDVASSVKHIDPKFAQLDPALFEQVEEGLAMRGNNADLAEARLREAMNGTTDAMSNKTALRDLITRFEDTTKKLEMYDTEISQVMGTAKK
jgi:hypothetical protein